jgi:hypothetical protein
LGLTFTSLLHINRKRKREIKMAAVTATVQNLSLVSTSGGPRRNSAGKEIESALVTVTPFAGTYVQGAGAATISAINTAIQNKRRDARVVTILQAAIAAPGSEAGVLQGALACTVAANVISTQLTQADMVTERAATAMGVYDFGLTFHVFYLAQ